MAMLNQKALLGYSSHEYTPKPFLSVAGLQTSLKASPRARKRGDRLQRTPLANAVSRIFQATRLGRGAATGTKTITDRESDGEEADRGSCGEAFWRVVTSP
jgi:hypothetical protein